MAHHGYQGTITAGSAVSSGGTHANLELNKWELTDTMAANKATGFGTQFTGIVKGLISWTGTASGHIGSTAYIRERSMVSFSGFDGCSTYLADILITTVNRNMDNEGNATASLSFEVDGEVTGWSTT